MTKTTDIALSFSHLMKSLRNNETQKAIDAVNKNPALLNMAEKTLDMVSVGRFTTPFLLACTYNENKFLNHTLTNPKFQVNYLDQSHCGQQALAHAVVRNLNSDAEKQQQTQTVKLLLKNARKNLNNTDYKQFLLGGGEWQRTAVYNSLQVAKNDSATDEILNEIKYAGYIKDTREQILQLNRPIFFYANTKNHLKTLLSDLNDTQKIEMLKHTDDVGSTVLHWAKNPDTAQYILDKAPELATVKDYDGRTPAETTFAAGYNSVSDIILKATGDQQDSIRQTIDNQIQTQALQNALGNFINSVCFNLPVHDNIKNNLINNLDNFTQGTQEFLISHGLRGADYKPTEISMERFKHQHQFGIENEFHMPKKNEPFIQNLLTIFNRELPESPKEILKFGQDPEPSVLSNAPDGGSVELVSPIIRIQHTADKVIQINDIAQDLGAEKNATSGIHVHVGCENHVSKQNQSLQDKTDATDKEIQMAFLKTFLHVVQEARPVFDGFCRSKHRQDYPKAWDSKDIQALDLANNKSPKEHYYTQVDNLKDFSELPEFTITIGRGKYVLAAPPKDSKGTIEVRELKNSKTNAVGMNNEELKNIFNFVKKMANMTSEIIQENPPKLGEIYKPEIKPETIRNITKEAILFAQKTQQSLTQITPKIKAVPKRELEVRQLRRDISRSIKRHAVDLY